jgi:EAL domain-containing protein (putative c-di-GMP-specific phosphodiesterase class I)
MPRSAIRVLVLDDDPFMRKLLAHMLRSLGFDAVTTCESGPAALQWVDAPGMAPDLILLDLNMPDMDGIEFMRKLVEHQFRGSLILVSGEDERVLQMAEKLVQAHRLTTLGHLSKPVSMAKLTDAVALWRHAQEAQQTEKKRYSALALGLAMERGELVNHYQPKIQVATGAVVGVETLVRWQHPEDGMVYPDQFIHVAEDHGLIGDLTRGVLSRALAQTRLWQDSGLALRVAINVSMQNLQSVDFVDFVAAEAVAARVAPQNIVLEITESQLMLDQRAPLEVLSRLRLKRFCLSIDDFGTGNSSLTQLHAIPFDELKIDKSFVHNAWRDPTGRAMYDASLSLGKQLGMQVVAEGVEDRDDWALLQTTQCDLAQGYFIARPMPGADMAGWIAAWNGRHQQRQGARTTP